MDTTWWRHQMETFFMMLALCEGIHQSSVDSPHKGQCCQCHFLRSAIEQSRCWCFEMPLRSLWCHSNERNSIHRQAWIQPITSNRLQFKCSLGCENAVPQFCANPLCGSIPTSMPSANCEIHYHWSAKNELEFPIMNNTLFPWLSERLW